MKKRYIVIIILIAIVILSIIGYFVTQNIIKEGRKYEIAEIKEYNYFVLKQGDNYGVIDNKGNIVINAKYENVKIPNPEKAIFVCYEEGKTKILNNNQEEIYPDFENIEPLRLKNVTSDLMYEKSVLKYEKNGKYGLISLDGRKITNAIYDEIDTLPYKEGELIVKQEEKYGIINIKGNNLVKIEYENISADGYYTETDEYKYAGYIVSLKTDEGYRYGYVNINGKEILKPEYNEITRITQILDDENAYLITAKNGQYGIYKNEEKIIENEFQSIRYDKTNNIVVVEKSKKYGVCSLDGESIIPVKYDQIDITGIYLYAKNEQGTVVLDNKGNQVNIDVNIAILNTDNEKYKIKINNKNGTLYSVIDKNNKEVIEEKYNYIEYLFDDYFIVSNKEGKLGILDNKGNEKVEIIYDSIQKVQNTKILQAITSENKTIDLYSNKLEKICQMQNATIESTDKFIKIYNENEIKYFDLNGNELKNTDVFEQNKLFAKFENGKWGHTDKNGNTVVSIIYDKVTEFNEYGFAGIKKDGKWGIVDENGKIILEPTYDLKNQIEPEFIGKFYQVKYGFGEIYYTNL